MNITPEDVLAYHRGERPGKLQIQATKPLLSQRDLSLAYTPGVGLAVLALADDPLAAYEYTAKGNLVAVVTNGTAVLGLGNRGPLAAKPVMEGKAVLFKRLADVDVFDIELNAPQPEEVIAAVRAIAPGFGGINLEDIAAPACFQVEEHLQEALDIPVFHDDQHGTAIITAAALINAADLAGKSLSDLRVVVVGAGAAGVASARMFVEIGVPRAQITMFDKAGMVYEGRAEDMNPYNGAFAQPGPPISLADALQGADVLLGVSAANVVTAEMLRGMAADPILLLLANPDPEIAYDLAVQTRPDAIVATGRSDYPNQVNNVLVFPYVFRGALDVRASAINGPMKLAAAHALAALAREPVPDSVLLPYGLDHLKFGRNYIIPKPNDHRVLEWVAPAVAEAAISSHVARRAVDLDTYRSWLEGLQRRGWRIMHAIMEKAQTAPKRMVFAEGEHPKVLHAARDLEREGIASPILLGRPEIIATRISELGLQFAPEVVNPSTSPLRRHFTDQLYHLRQRKGITRHHAEEMVRSPNIFGLMMVKTGQADGFLSGLTFDYPAVVKPILQIIRTRPGAALMAGVYMVLAHNRAFFFTDGLINIDPSAEDLAEIAILTADFVRELDIDPHIAMISFSNFGSVPDDDSLRVRQAVSIVEARRPDLNVDGEMQADTALNRAIVDEYYPFSRVREANVLVFPNLDAANSSIKVLSQLGEVDVIGPILIGASKSVQVLQHAVDVRSIVRLTAVAVVDAQALARPGSEG